MSCNYPNDSFAQSRLLWEIIDLMINTRLGHFYKVKLSGDNHLPPSFDVKGSPTGNSDPRTALYEDPAALLFQSYG